MNARVQLVSSIHHNFYCSFSAKALYVHAIDNTSQTKSILFFDQQQHGLGKTDTRKLTINGELIFWYILKKYGTLFYHFITTVITSYWQLHFDKERKLF